MRRVESRWLADVRKRPDASRGEPVTLIQVDGSVMAVAFNACVLALIDAGVPMYDFAVACNVAHVLSTSLLDPNLSELINASELWVCVLPRSMQVLSFGIRGKIACDVVPSLITMAQQGCSQLFGMLESFVVKGIEKN